MSLLTKTIIFLLVIFLTACQAKQKQGPADIAKPTTQKPSLPEETKIKGSLIGLKAYVKATPAPDKYEVHLSWEDLGEVSPAWILSKTSEKETRQLGTLRGEKREYTDEFVVAGKTYRYSVGIVDFENYKILEEIEVAVPKDFVISKTIKATSLKGFNRLFLRPSARLTTDGEDFTVDVNEIISEGAVIETFSEYQKASYEKGGRSGGKITIKANTATGELRIVARGEHGGDGIAGKQGEPGKKQGAKGKNGQCGHVDGDNYCQQMDVQSWARLKQIIKSSSLTGFSKFYNRFYCKVQTEDGKPGEAGNPGRPGTNGGDGGDSARVLVEIKNATEIKVQIESIAGHGGKGGRGGYGGQGGPGGIPGVPDHLALCRFAMPGPQGPLGPRGPLGASGALGKEQPWCKKLGSTWVGDCEVIDKG